MGHDHHKITSLNGIYILCIALNLGFVVIEAGVGFWQNSIGLLSDAGHNLTDTFSLLLAMLAFKLSSSKSRKRYTYGFRKSSVLISLLNAIILLGVVVVIIAESIQKFKEPQAINGAAISWTAGVGIIVNGLTAFLLMKQQSHDINTRGAFLHMVADTLVSVGVVISGIVITHTGWTIIDPIISLVIAGVIFASCWELFVESLRMSMDAVPEGIDPDKIKEIIKAEDGVTGVHHMHIWPISTTETALTAHVVVSDIDSCEETVHRIKQTLRDNGIGHATIEAESKDCGEI